MRKPLTIIIMLTLAICLCAGTPAMMAEGTSVTGAGDAVYVDLDIFDVILPTAGSLDFFLDPQGLLSLESGQSVPIEELQGGRIVHMSDARIISNSAYSVKVSIELRVTSASGDHEDGAVATFMEFLDDEDATIASVEPEGGTANNILLYAIPSATNLPNHEEPFVPSETGYIIQAEPRSLEFILPAAIYTVGIDSDDMVASSPIPGTGNGVALRFGGYVNTNADWSDFRAETGPSTVTVYATYTLTRADIEDLEAPRAEGIPNMLAPEPENAVGAR